MSKIIAKFWNNLTTKHDVSYQKKQKFTDKQHKFTDKTIQNHTQKFSLKKK